MAERSNSEVIDRIEGIFDNSERNKREDTDRLIDEIIDSAEENN